MILGLDLGTSMVKVAAFREDGECLGTASRRAVLCRKGGGVIEQDFEDIVTSVGEVLSEVCDGLEAGPRVIGITGQSDGLWLLDDRGYAVRPAVSWLDDRGNPYLQDWIDRGIYERVFRRNGNAIFPGSHAPLIAALADGDPEALDRAATASYLKDAILQRLTGVRATDASDASLPFLDIRKRDYDPEILRLLGLERFDRLLAPVRAAPEAFPMTASGAALTGLPEGTLVHAGPFDLPACAIGAGVDRVGDGLITLGTTLACQVLVDRIDTGGEPAGMTLCMPRDGRWMRALPATVGTATLDWVLDLVGAPHGELDRILSESAPGANGVTALPYFSSTGERAPFCDVNARGLLSGLSTATRPADLVMAVCEAVAYAARHCIEAAGLTGRLSVCGGGANSATWTQMLADVLQQPLHVARGPEVGARGAALVAMEAAGIAHDPAAWTRSQNVVAPRPETAVHHDAGFRHYLATVAAARPLWRSRPKPAVPARPPAKTGDGPCRAI